MAKAIIWKCSDTEVRRCGEQTGLDTLVVHTVNDECYVLEFSFSASVNTVSIPPGEYGRKIET